ncbi:MAG: CDP-alcohol phosphatidyltransferase family protein [Porphyromonadaceae bacterium]|nr:CDP-alcohol phosphatidyltransferase family protein [Porphyromonadaceae bacterium]
MSRKNASPRPSLASTLKSRDTEETFDLLFYRPIGYLWALICRRLGIVPNAVTILAIVLGTAGGILLFFGQLSFTVGAIILIVFANSLDSADGQLARMTGQYSRLGRFLDGMCGDIWFVVIYFAVAYRLSQEGWGIYAYLLGLFTGPFHAKQAAMADYYRNFHLFILKGKQQSEWDDSTRLADSYARMKWFPNFLSKLAALVYLGYTRQQERTSPALQKLRALLNKRYGEEWPEEFRQAFRRQSKPLMKYTNILTFNTRIFVLFIVMLLDKPLYYFLFELTVMNLLLLYMIVRHEHICRRFTEALEKEGEA